MSHLSRLENRSILVKLIPKLKYENGVIEFLIKEKISPECIKNFIDKNLDQLDFTEKAFEHFDPEFYNFDFFKYFSELGFDCNYVKESNNTFLMYVIEKIGNGAYRYVKYFCDKNINLNHCNNNGDTILHLAVKKNDMKSIIKLLITKCDLKIRNNNGLKAKDITSCYDFMLKKQYVLEHKKKLIHLLQ